MKASLLAAATIGRTHGLDGYLRLYPLSGEIEHLMKLEEAVIRLRDGSEKKVIAEFKGGEIQVIAGNYGPYIKAEGGNYRIPKGMDAEALTEADCVKIVETETPTGRSKRRRTR